ncbi:MAG: peroxiredoxin family protein [Bacteroidales bacterium]|nr:peroxiredoxin family protein [Bacteroidales bacterium]
MNRIYLIITFIISINSAFSQEYSVYGNAATYSGTTLEMYVYSDYITKTKQIISRCKVDEEGYFSFKLTEKDTVEAFIDLDVFIGRIILEPGKDFKIVLPKKTVRNDYDRLNPYFEPMQFYIRILNGDDNITSAIKLFNRLMEQSNKIIFKDKTYINSGIVEKEIKKIDDSTSYISNSFFNNYKKYKFLYLRHLTFYKNKKAIIRKDFSGQKLFAKNPAYNEMLEKSFKSFIFQTNGDTLYNFLSADYSWNNYMNYLAKDKMFYNKEFREYLFLLNLSKLFYRNSTYQKSIIKLLRSAKSTDITKQSEIIIYNFLNKSAKLIVGNPIPYFSLPDENELFVSPDEFEDNFVYLCFYNKDSYACQKEIELLNQLNKKEIDLLKIVTIFVDENSDYIKDLKENKEYDWTLLYCNKKDKVLSDYKVVAYPTYYLIHPTGTLSLYPAPSPAENFESVYYKAYQSWKRKLIRDENK